MLLGKKTITNADTAQARTQLQTIPLVMMGSASLPEGVLWVRGHLCAGLPRGARELTPRHPHSTKEGQEFVDK